MAHKLAFIGFGGVGQGLTEIIRDKREKLTNEVGLDAEVVAVSDLKLGSAYHSEGLDIQFAAEDLQDAIQQANAVNYGLQAGIFTQRIDKAHEAIEKLEVSGVIVNDSSDYRIDAMPFGGVKSSGIGREGVKFTIEAMTEKKVVCFNLDKS